MPFSTTIRTASKVVSRPFQQAKSSRSLHLSIAPLVVELQAETAENSAGEKFRLHLFTNLFNINNYNQKVCQGGFQTYSTS
jgi:hypothetical protein